MPNAVVGSVDLRRYCTVTLTLHKGPVIGGRIDTDRGLADEANLDLVSVR